jgi:flagellar hook-associated protein 3 FlgL
MTSVSLSSVLAGDYSTSSTGTLGVLVSNSTALSKQLTTLTEQVSSGLVSNTYGGLGASAGVALQMSTAVAHNDTWAKNINSVTGQMDATQTALSQISSIASNFYSQTTNLNGLDSSEVDTIAASARQALQQVAGLLNTKYGDVYVFAGQDSSVAPVPNADSITQSGFYTAISTAVSNLGTNGATATIASTLATASSNAAGTSPFSTELSQSATTLASFRPTVQVGENQYATVGIVASANGDVTSTGTSTTGSYIRDIMRGLATLGSLSSGQVSTTGFDQLVSDTRTSLSGAISALNVDAGILGNQESSLTTTKDTLTSVSTTLKTQVSNIEDVDSAKALSNLSAVQTQLQASYEVISTLQSLSLTKYMSG